MDDVAKKYLHDILQSALAIEGYLGGSRNFDDFKKNRLLKRAIEREFEIIGEATNQLLKIVPDIPITDARKIVDLRNLIIHSYDKVMDEILWGIIIKNLPLLRDEVQDLLN